MDEILVQIAPEIDREIPPEIPREIFKPNLTKEQETELIEKCLRLKAAKVRGFKNSTIFEIFDLGRFLHLRGSNRKCFVTPFLEF